MSTREQAAAAAALPPVEREEVVHEARYDVFRSRLKADQIRLTGQLRVLRDKIRLSKRDEHMADADEVAQNESQLGSDTSAIRSLDEQLHAVHMALQALEDGTYGLCTTCGEEIAEKRLDALPFAEDCIKCLARAGAQVAHVSHP